MSIPDLLNRLLNCPTSALSLTGEDQALLVRRDALLVLDLGLHVVDRVRRLDLQSDGLSGQRLYEDLHFDLLCV